jgi:hypothetical protein
MQTSTEKLVDLVGLILAEDRDFLAVAITSETTEELKRLHLAAIDDRRARKDFMANLALSAVLPGQKFSESD